MNASAGEKKWVGEAVVEMIEPAIKTMVKPMIKSAIKASVKPAIKTSVKTITGKSPGRKTAAVLWGKAAGMRSRP